MNDTDEAQDPAAIERDIRRTQEDMSQTVDKIEGQLTPRNLLNSLLDAAESNDVDARSLLDGARRNPLALAMIGAGAIWLISGSDAKLPSFGSRSKGDHSDPHHRDYVAHMERIELRDGEDPLSYQRRRDIARANYLMIERGHDEDESGFRKRLDEAGDKFRERRHALSEQSRKARGAVAAKGRRALSGTGDLYDGNPLVGGLIAAAVGAIAGTSLPITRTEEEQLSDLGGKARKLAGEQTDKLAGAAREKKDQLVASVEEKAKPHEDSPAMTSGSPQAVR